MPLGPFYRLISYRCQRQLLGGRWNDFVRNTGIIATNKTVQEVVEHRRFSVLSAKLHYTDTGYGHVVQHHQRTSSQQFYNLLYNKFATSQCHAEPNISACQDVGMWQIFLSVGGEFVVQQVVELL